MILDFSDCKTVEDVNSKWLSYAKDMEPYKSLFKRLETLDSPEVHSTGESELPSNRNIPKDSIKKKGSICKPEPLRSGQNNKKIR